ncbi:hypothetical protein J2Z21_005791 [Streptomyces griseochromogenes]|uniref:Uncharacterized protein n=1 Tax=Streptomyces griseochromogenes TaxID=68214 RepID=A0A1B1APN2_9ACTN|nr:hypothetical protein [Streptomyces griseochromogenes]ANP48521.1 hypothetical protein AVL59_02075 [Streptomyces griseochromogenes]MBP2052802.1 hypothetical protein [Streptomyces griseochromogenes]
MAKTGYGKRSAGDEDPHADPDFAHLHPRDAEIAVFIDHLDNGHAMGHKVLAAEHPRYGQQAFRTALNHLTEAGHLRWIKEHITVEDNSMRWVTRTYWSRTPRSPEWWADFARERDGKDVTDYQPGLARTEDPAPRSAPGVVPGDEPTPDEPGAAYRILAGLRAADPRMPLSETDCRSLEHLAAEWLSRGATPNDITRALTDGLPSTVSNPGGLARNRLEAKMPPQKSDTSTAPARPLRGRVTRVIMACASCDQDERTVRIDRGICEDCRKECAENPMTDEDIAKGFAEIAHLGVTSARFLKQKLERRTGGAVPDTFRSVPIEDRVFYHYRDNRDRIANGLPPRRWNP